MFLFLYLPRAPRGILSNPICASHPQLFNGDNSSQELYKHTKYSVLFGFTVVEMTENLQIDNQSRIGFSITLSENK